MGVLAAGFAGASWMLDRHGATTETFIAKVTNYRADITSVIRAGLQELRVTPQEISGKKILLKPNLVEVYPNAEHINTHPLVVRGAIEAFLALGAARVMVGEGPGHCRDHLYVVEGAGLEEVLYEDHIPFIDLNNDTIVTRTNMTGLTRLATLALPASLYDADWIVSLAKMKTHHWAGVTLSMKNLFGVMPGAVYGWPKNVLHQVGIEKSILDINSTVKPHFAIVDGIVGMEGDGPIMGAPKQAGVLVMGRNLPGVDATCCRIMGIDPHRVSYLQAAAKYLGPVDERRIIQLGERLADIRTNFLLHDNIPAQRNLRLHNIGLF
jgi:uncharacterized protein (DUF362 family)